LNGEVARAVVEPSFCGKGNASEATRVAVAIDRRVRILYRPPVGTDDGVRAVVVDGALAVLVDEEDAFAGGVASFRALYRVAVVLLIRDETPNPVAWAGEDGARPKQKTR
jgi:hypothetical protein